MTRVSSPSLRRRVNAARVEKGKKTLVGSLNLVPTRSLLEKSETWRDRMAYPKLGLCHRLGLSAQDMGNDSGQFSAGVQWYGEGWPDLPQELTSSSSLGAV
jgi:hypothetical protein